MNSKCFRFEKLDITPKSAQKIKPVLERWMKEAEERYVSNKLLYNVLDPLVINANASTVICLVVSKHRIDKSDPCS